jgi:hypothetical protein
MAVPTTATSRGHAPIDRARRRDQQPSREFPERRLMDQMFASSNPLTSWLKGIDALQQSRKTIEMDPNFGLAHNHSSHHPFEEYATGRFTKQQVLEQARALGPDEPPESSTYVASDWGVAEQSTLRRHRGRSGVRRSRKTRRLRAIDFRGLVLPRAVGAVESRAEHDATAAGALGLPTTRLRALREGRRGPVGYFCTPWQLGEREGQSRSPYNGVFEPSSFAQKVRPAFAATPLRRGILRVARRAEAHASALARVSEGWWPRFSPDGTH